MTAHSLRRINWRRGLFTGLNLAILIAFSGESNLLQKYSAGRQDPQPFTFSTTAGATFNIHPEDDLPAALEETNQDSEHSGGALENSSLSGEVKIQTRSHLQREAEVNLEAGALGDRISGIEINREDPLRFAFPTSTNPIISAWRPALYPVPWALTPMDHFYFTRPILADEINWPLEDYRYGGVFFEDVVHTGVDITAPIGTPVLAAASGKVTWAGFGLYNGSYDPEDPYGLAILVRHDFGFHGARLYTVYAHLSEASVEKGQRVEVGSLIGLSGDTGKATGPHLHFEVRQETDGFFSTFNPELWLVPPQGWGVIAGRVMNTGGLKLKSQLVQVVSPASGKIWKANTYGGGSTHEDPYYRENVAIGDLPAGRYEVQIRYQGKDHTLEVDIQPGLITYFTFRGWSGFTSEPLVLPGADFNPILP